MTQWRIAQLAAGEKTTKQLNFLCLNPDDRARVQATVASQQTAAVAADAATQIAPGAAPPVERPMIDPPPAAAGNLKVTIADMSDPIKLGEKTSYTIELTNERAVSDRDVVLTLELGEGLKVSGASGPSAVASSSPDGRLIELAPIAEIRPGEKLPAYKIEVTAVKPGKFKARISAKSARTTTPVTAEAETTVNMP
jgi:hypothetical protein